MTQGEVRPSMEILMHSMSEIADEEFDLERVLITGIMNVTIAAANMVLAATALGLGTCWMRAFDATAVERLLDIPEGLSVLTLLPLGYPDESPPPRPRKSIEEILI
jgi:nitroreductase